MTPVARLEDPIVTRRRFLTPTMLALFVIGTCALSGLQISQAADAQLHGVLDYTWQAFLAVGSLLCLAVPRAHRIPADLQLAGEAAGAFLVGTAFVAFAVIYIRATGSGAIAAISVTLAFAGMFYTHALTIARRLAVAALRDRFTA